MLLRRGACGAGDAGRRALLRRYARCACRETSHPRALSLRDEPTPWRAAADAPLLSPRAPADIDAELARAGGANYDAGNTAAGVKAGHAGELKHASKAFFQQKDAETQIKNIQFEKARALCSVAQFASYV